MNDHGGSSSNGSSSSTVIELNVGGVIYATSLGTLTRDQGSLLAQIFAGLAASGGGSGGFPGGDAGTGGTARDGKGRHFIDRDGVLFRFVLDYLRGGTLVLPEGFQERDRLRQEAEFFRLSGMLKYIPDPGGDWSRRHLAPSPTSGGGTAPADPRDPSPALTVQASGDNISPSTTPGTPSWRTNDPGYITVGYRGTFAFGRDGGQADVKFRKLWRILVSGRVALCREVFRDTLNESRDVERGTTDRYSARFFLKHVFIEQAFDMLQDCGFRMVGAAGSGTNSAGEMKPGMDSEENKWNHYNEFIFCR